MIAGVAIVPTAPILVEGISPVTPDGIAAVRRTARGVLGDLADADAAVIVAAGDATMCPASQATLAGVGRPDLARSVQIADWLVGAVADAAAYAIVESATLGLDHSVMSLLWPEPPPLAAISVPAGESFPVLAGIGEAIARAAGESGRRVAVVAAGDLSAGLTSKSPLAEVSGAIFFDEQAAAAVDASRLDGLARIGPAEAARVGARGWAPMCVLAGVTARTKIGTVVRSYSAPRGVGYLVAAG